MGWKWVLEKVAKIGCIHLALILGSAFDFWGQSNSLSSSVNQGIWRKMLQGKLFSLKYSIFSGKVLFNLFLFQNCPIVPWIKTSTYREIKSFCKTRTKPSSQLLAVFFLWLSWCSWYREGNPVVRNPALSWCVLAEDSPSTLLRWPCVKYFYALRTSC
jgi:hypothetical protein